MVRNHRGYRNVIDETSRLPTWAKNLLATLRAVPRKYRQNCLRILRFLHDFLEKEWSHDPEPTPNPVKIEDDEPVAKQEPRGTDRTTLPLRQQTKRERSPTPISNRRNATPPWSRDVAPRHEQ